MRRLTTWLLILALVLLALCLLWLLPRLLHEEAPPEQNLAAVPADQASGPVEIQAPGPPASDPSEVPNAGPVGPGGSAADRADAAERRATSGSEPSTGSLAGRVLDRGGRSVPGVLVLAAHAPDLGAPIAAEASWISHLPLDVADPSTLGAEIPLRATTDELGAFRIDGLEPGHVRIAVRSPRHAPLDRNDVRLGSGQLLPLGDLVLEAAAWVDGSLFDADDRPVQDVRIVASDVLAGASLPPLAAERGVVLARTEVRGLFRAGPLGPGPCRLHALASRVVEDAAIDVLDAGAGGEYVVTMPEDARIAGQVLVRGGRSGDLVVRAVPAETARGPVPFHVRGDARSATVNRDGSFALEGLAHGVLYELRAGSALSRFEDAGLWSPPGFATAPDERVRLLWSADAGVAFDLVDARNRSSIAACRVAFERALPAYADLGRPGPHEIGGVRPTTAFRTIGIQITSRGFEPRVQTLQISAGTTSTLGELPMNPAPRLAVRVVDAATERPIERAFVRATEVSTGLDASGFEPEALATDASGTAVVVSYFGAGSRVHVDAPGYAPASLVGPFGYGYSEPKLVVPLVRGATARIRVVAEDGTPLPGTRVEWVRGDWTPPVARADDAPRPIAEWQGGRTSRITDAEGRVAFTELPPGRHAFLVQRHRAPFLEGEWTQRDLRDGETQEIELQSLARSTLELRIADGGLPLAGAPMCLLRAEDAARSLDVADSWSPLPPGLDARLDARGRALLREIDGPVRCVLAVLVDGSSRRACFPIQVRAGANVFSIDLSASAVTGTVRDTEQAPAAGVEIFYAEEARVQDLKARARRGTLLAGAPDPGIERPVATTDEAGRFRILGLPLETPFVLLARAPGGEASPGGVRRTEPMVLTAGQGALDVPITLSPAGAIEILPRSAPELEPCTVVATARSGGVLPRFRRIYPGRAELVYGLQAGLWDLEFADDAGRRDRQRVEVVAGQVSTVEPRLP